MIKTTDKKKFIGAFCNSLQDANKLEERYKDSKNSALTGSFKFLLIIYKLGLK